MGQTLGRTCSSLTKPEKKVTEGPTEWTPSGWMQPHRYLVKDGDTLQSVAQHFVRDVGTIVEDNPVIRFNHDRQGNQLPTLEHSPEQILIITKNERDKFMWYARAALLGHPVAQFCLSRMYASEDGVVSPEWEKELEMELDLEKQKEIQRRRVQGHSESEIAKFSLRMAREIGLLRGPGMRTRLLAGGAPMPRHSSGSRASRADLGMMMDDGPYGPMGPPSGRSQSTMSLGGGGSRAGMGGGGGNAAYGQEDNNSIISEEQSAEQDPEVRAVVNSFFWLRMSASHGYAQAQYRLANLFFFNNETIELVLKDERKKEYAERAAKSLETLKREKRQRDGDDDAEEIVVNRANSHFDLDQPPVVSEPLKPPEDIESLRREEADGRNKLEAAQWYERAAKQGHTEAAAQLGRMFTEGVGIKRDYLQAITWLHVSGLPLPEAERMVFTKNLEDAKQGVAKASLQVGKMYLDGVGAKMEWDKAVFWFQRAGKSEKWAQNQIEIKKDSLQARYLELFQAHDLDGDGNLDKSQFRGFYMNALMASRGLKPEVAYTETVSTYQGQQRCDVLFALYDADKSRGVSFEEIWHNRRRDALFPKTEKQFQQAIQFFTEWNANGNPPTLFERQASSIIEKTGKHHLVPMPAMIRPAPIVAPPKSGSVKGLLQQQGLLQAQPYQPQY